MGDRENELLRAFHAYSAQAPYSTKSSGGRVTLRCLTGAHETLSRTEVQGGKSVSDDSDAIRPSRSDVKIFCTIFRCRSHPVVNDSLNDKK